MRERARRAVEGRPSKFCSVLLTSGGAVDERVVPAGTRGFGRLLPPWRPTPLPFCRRQRVAALEDLERALRMSLWRARHSCERRRCGGQSTRSRRSWKFAASSIAPPRRSHLTRLLTSISIIRGEWRPTRKCDCTICPAQPVHGSIVDKSMWLSETLSKRKWCSLCSLLH